MSWDGDFAGNPAGYPADSNPYVVGEERRCPRCGGRFRWWREYADHAWTEKP